MRIPQNYIVNFCIKFDIIKAYLERLVRDDRKISGVEKCLKKYTNVHLAIDTKIGLFVALALHAGDGELKVHLVDGYAVVTGVVLQNAREEGLGEVEAGYPEHYGWALVYPVL